MAGSLAGAIFRDLGADVVRVQTDNQFTLDQGIEYEKVWNRGKEVITVCSDDDRAWATVVTALSAEADILVMAGAHPATEIGGLCHRQLADDNRRLIVANISPGVDMRGTLPYVELLLHARTGMMTQFRPNRPGPAFVDLTLAGAGAALTATVGALASLYERETTQRGGWIETTMFGGMQALLAMVMGRVEYPSPSTNSLWAGLGPSMAPYLRCADDRYIQLWFGAKGAYEAFLERIGDPPSAEGYERDSLSGEIANRSIRWAELFATQNHSYWLSFLSGSNFRCEPVLRPGEALVEPYAREIGVSRDFNDPVRGRLTALGSIIECVPTADACKPKAAVADVLNARLCSDVKVLDLSAYLAGPITTQVLAELGADVMKVEPTTGDVHRPVEFMFAAGQRGKRAIGIDLKARESQDVLRRLFMWSDVVHHNARVGLAERLGYDEATARAANADIVYNHSTGFGISGSKALQPCNDHLIQALSGIEAAAGGDEQPPSYVPWGAIDVTGGWLGAVGILAGLYARRRDGVGQSVRSSLLGAGLTLKSGAFYAGGARFEGGILGSDQTGYGAAYRIYEAADGRWFALAILDADMWKRLVELLDSPELPPLPPRLRTRLGERKHPVESTLEATFLQKEASYWVEALAEVDVCAELVVEVDRVGFIRGAFDNPSSGEAVATVSFEWGERGVTEQPAFPLVFGPEPRPRALAAIPRLGEHTAEVLSMLGVPLLRQTELSEAGVISAPEGAITSS
jgi:crotonobetainyl-CoA:carnitine CoA-transferase CaiB-like acyl-CoA transferase